MPQDIREALTEAANALARTTTAEAREHVLYWIDTILDYINALRRQ